MGNHSLSDTRRALTPNGTLLSNGGGYSGGGLGTTIKVRVVTARTPAGRPSIKFQNPKDLVVLKELVEAGKVTPVIDGVYPLSGTAQAMGHVGEGHARGTVVITMPQPSVDAD